MKLAISQSYQETSNVSFDVALIRSNPVSNDPRVEKIVRSLSKKYSIIIFGWDREATHSPWEFVERKIIIKRLKLRAPYGKKQLVLCYPLFWMWVFCNLLIYRPKIIHSCDLDSLIPSYVFKIIFSVKLVFDSFDRYAMAFIPYGCHALYEFVNTFEEILSRNTDALITVSKERLSTFGEYKPKHSVVIMNCSEDILDREKRDKSPTDPYDNLVVTYTGGIARGRGLLLLESIIQNLNGIRLILAGRVCDDIINQLLRNPNVQYIGLLKHDEALELQKSADVIPLLYDPAIPINRVANPNKFFEAMMLGVPVITNVCREIVNTVGCGLVVEYNYGSIRDAILRLENDPSLRKEMGAKARIAFKRAYNWSLMEKKLLMLYHKLLTAKNDN
jgi:glycosyltransferase involved in cell wall biosynthesis